MRARILGQQYTAAKYVEKKQAHPLTVAPSPATYVGRGPVYYPPTQYRSQNRDEEETGGHLFGDDHEMTVIRPAPVTTTTPPLKPQLFDGMTMRGGRTNNNASFRSDASTTLRLTDDNASSVSDSRRTNSSDAQRRIVEQALLVHNSIQELRGHSALRNINTASMW
ncbi:Hypothetical protein, putative [Bodo saltans]|uniref:Uncharacterized protein n=1 Tax=Bodo saltans TaxID=75058 RepID=A0A0S4KG98_BODSA|nr:Hypothetical protein, putative [Bodo saltans]|eukprot:CUI14722.1 Hypothetical protein, putative [Bodo saltans]